MKRVTKKQQYINCIEHDLEFATKSLREMSMSTIKWRWYHGERKSVMWWEKLKSEMEREITLINSDRNYKPWTEFEF